MNQDAAPDFLPPLRDVVRRHGLLAKKSLGQNFLFDLNLTGRIARAAAPLEEATILEVGCLTALGEIAAAYPGRLAVVAGNALTIDFAALVGAHAAHGPARICANLPYNIGTALLVRWIETEPWPPWFDRLTLMFQREVAERIVATPVDRANYGRLAVLCNWRTQTRILFDVPARAFTPPPKVNSSVVELVPRRDPLSCDIRALASVTHAAFGQRRKMLRQSLKSLRKVDATELLRGAKVDPKQRAEEVDIEGFVALAQAYAQQLRR
jgi:16S rRNA (adenine1518-N6/adenine1519-N6)-dimethyltransferase